MKRKLSIKLRITLWYAAVIVFICAAAMLCLFGMSRYAQTVYCRDTLSSAVTVILDEMEIEHGVIEIDADIDEVPNVYAALFDLDGNLVYGRRRVEMPFQEGEVREARDGEHVWMILDTRISVPAHDELWLRVHMSADLSMGVAQRLSGWGVGLLPLLAVLALLGGYLLTSSALRPVKEMTRLAGAIAEGGDLSGRVAMDDQPGSGDELHALAGTLNAMLARLQAAFEHERQFTADAAHELRTPLNGMRTLGEYALSREHAEEKDDVIAQMLEKNESMRLTVDQLLLIARMDAGQISMEEDIDLRQMLEEIAQDMEPVAQERGIMMDTQLCPLFMRGSGQVLARAVINLVDNAIRYGRENGRVSLKLAQEGEEVVISVQDDGEGIAPQALERVFERLWRGDSARTTQGTGIGLAIVKSAARMHGGSAQASSELGAGSIFTIRLPKR
ncbi:MAG: HAMP domain-containing protein [Clostridia bacterium]|nr:HAMP domain-containing protein [Clostridia bacterium]